MMFNEDIRSKNALQHKKYTINRCTQYLYIDVVYDKSDYRFILLL